MALNDLNDICIVVAEDAPELERFAALELHRYLRMIFGLTVPIVSDDQISKSQCVLIGSPKTNRQITRDPRNDIWEIVSDQGIVLRGNNKESKWTVGGGSPVATMWAVYEMLERLGVRFFLSGDVFPDDPGSITLPDIDEHIEPVFSERIWRLMNDEPHGPEMWSLAECRRVIDQLAKMKMNGIYFLTYPSHPFVHYEFRGVKKSTAVLDFGFRYPIDEETIGRKLFGDVDQFTNPEFRHCDSYEDMVETGQKYAREVFQYAMSKGMRIGLGFSITSVTDEFKGCLQEWIPTDNEYESSDQHNDYVRLGKLSMGTPPGDHSIQNVDNPILADLASEIVRAHLDTYPEVTFIEIGSSEFRGSVRGHKYCWNRLDEKYGIESIVDLETLEDEARSREYHVKGRAERELRGDIEFLYFVDKLFTEQKLLDHLGRSDVEVLLSSVTEEMYPILGRVLPDNFGIGAMLDYNLSLAMPRIDRISSLSDSDFGKYATLSVQDDMNSLLIASEGSNIETFLGVMKQSGFNGWKSRYWSIGDLDHSTSFLSKASWDAELTKNDAYDDYIVHVFGEDCLLEMRHALNLMEENSVFQGTEVYAVGFPYPGLMKRHFEIKRDQEGPHGPNEPLLKCRDMYDTLVGVLEAALPKVQDRGKKNIEYMIGRAKSCALFLETAYTVERAGFSRLDADQARRDSDPEELGRKLNDTAELLERALYLAGQTINEHISIVRDESDMGLLAAMNQNMYKYIKAQFYLASNEASLWHI